MSVNESALSRVIIFLATFLNSLTYRKINGIQVPNFVANSTLVVKGLSNYRYESVALYKRTGDSLI